MKKIAVASGKGGTGKSTVSLLFALILSEDYRVKLIDCDVEEPNCHLFLEGPVKKQEPVKIFSPGFDLNKCTRCKKCEEVCEFNALVVTEKKILHFPELCHNCKGCLIVCPVGAVSDSYRVSGIVYDKSIDKKLSLRYAEQNIGEAKASPLIEAIKKDIQKDVQIVIYDSPPGAGCSMVETVNNADYVILIAEPTPFGLSDLKVTVEVLKKINVRTGLVINSSQKDNSILTDYASNIGLDILLNIPYSKEFAREYSRGIIVPDIFPGLKESVKELIKRL
ncbi:MAG: ATP-binding protein [Elusimicrobia bacterium]|jgi:MinD superfamily P-loop ATPase|nr:ATP-binding protein [Elusimicrobiota bacterium]